MNIVRELRIKKGLQQKELALELGISSAAVSNWEKGKSDPSGERLQKLAEIFGVDEGFILGYGMEKPDLFVPENPNTSGISETEQIVQHVLDKLQPKSPQIRIVSSMMENLPKETQDQIVAIVEAVVTHQKKEG